MGSHFYAAGNGTSVSVEGLGSIYDDLAAFEKGFLKSAASLLVLLAAILVSQWQQLGLEVDMLVSQGRGFLQLTVVGFVLNFIFNQTGLSGIAWMFGAFCLMVTTDGNHPRILGSVE